MRYASALAGTLFLCHAGLVIAQAPCPAPTPTPQPPAWTGDASLGLSVTKGNADTDNFNLAGNVLYDPKTSVVFKTDASYLRADNAGSATADRSSAGARLERKVSGGAYLFGEVRYLRDQFKEIQYLVSPLVGVGYSFVKTPSVTFSVDASVGGAFEKDNGVSLDSSGALKFGESLSFKISPSATLGELGSALYKTNDFSDSLYHAEASLATSVTKHSQLKLTFQDDYKNRPVDPALKKNDLTLLTAFVMKF